MPSNLHALDERYARGARTREANLELAEEASEPDVVGRHHPAGNIKLVAHRMPAEETFDVLRYRTSTSARGFVRYIRIRPDKPYRAWICDDCNKPITESQFMTHAEDEH